MFGARASAARGCELRDADLKDLFVVPVEGAGPDKMEAIGTCHFPASSFSPSRNQSRIGMSASPLSFSVVLKDHGKTNAQGALAGHKVMAPCALLAP
jgi:hypothetical protein